MNTAIFPLAALILTAMQSSQHLGQDSTPQVLQYSTQLAENTQIEVTASQLHEEYHANEVAADKKYKDKVVMVTGIVDSINKSMFGEMYVSLKTGNEVDYVRCYFGKEYEDMLSKTKKGDEVHIKGTCKGMIMGDVLVKECSQGHRQRND